MGVVLRIVGLGAVFHAPYAIAILGIFCHLNHPISFARFGKPRMNYSALMMQPQISQHPAHELVFARGRLLLLSRRA